MKPHISQTLEILASVNSEILALNVDILAGGRLKTEQELFDVNAALMDKIGTACGVDGSAVRIASKVLGLYEERAWRGWWYWIEARRKERWIEREKDWKGKEKEEQSGKDGGQRDGDVGVVGDLRIDIMGTRIPKLKKCFRDMSREEREEDYMRFYELLNGELRDLPVGIEGIEGVMGVERRVEMRKAIEKSDEFRAAEEKELDMDMDGKQSDENIRAITRADENQSKDLNRDGDSRHLGAQRRDDREVPRSVRTPVPRAGRSYQNRISGTDRS
jgi:hypothetical protein